MNIQPVQQCRSLDGWQAIRVPSESQEHVRYTVLVNGGGGPDAAICMCPGFTFNHHCKHQVTAYDRLCGWHELDDDQQTEEQRQDQICPGCGGDTMWVMENVDV